MSARLFRFTPHGGKPNHYTDSFRSAVAQASRDSDELDADCDEESLTRLTVGQTYDDGAGTWERIA